MKTLTPKAVAKIYGVHVDTVRDWIKSKLLPATDCRRSTARRPRYRMDADDLRQFEQKRKVQQLILETRQRLKAAERTGANV